MKLRALERHLLEGGARKVGEGANHTKWRGPTGSPSVVPQHREIDAHLVRKMCRDLGRRAEDLDRRAVAAALEQLRLVVGPDEAPDRRAQLIVGLDEAPAP